MGEDVFCTETYSQLKLLSMLCDEILPARRERNRFLPSTEAYFTFQKAYALNRETRRALKAACFFHDETSKP